MATAVRRKYLIRSPRQRGQLALICAADFVVWLGGGAIYPYLPVFLHEHAHASVTMVGVIASAYFLAVFAFSAPAGRLSDRIGRKPMMVSGTSLFAISTVLFLTSTDPWWFVAFRILEGIGTAAVVPAAQAFIAEISSNENRSQSYGWLTTAQYGGLILGPALAWPFYALGGHGARAFYAIFVFGSALSALAAGALALYMREPLTAAATGRGKRVRAPWRSLLSRPVAAIILVVASAQFAMGAFEVVWSIYLRDLHASITLIGLTWVLFSAPLLLSFAAGRLADRHSRFALMFTGFGVQALCWCLVPVLHSPLLFLIVLPADGLALAFAFPAKQAFLVQVSPSRWLGSVQGAEQTAMQLTALAGTASAAPLYGWFGAGVFAIAGAVAIAGLAIAGPVLRREWRRIDDAGAIIGAAEVSTRAAQTQAVFRTATDPQD
jgi:MFS family permease